MLKNNANNATDSQIGWGVIDCKYPLKNLKISVGIGSENCEKHVADTQTLCLWAFYRLLREVYTKQSDPIAIGCVSNEDDF